MMSNEHDSYHDTYDAADDQIYQNGQGDGYYDDDEQTFTVDSSEVRAHNAADESRANAHADRPDSDTPSGPRGTKRKDSVEGRISEPGATTAILVSELHWWTTEDDLRGWVNSAGAEHDLKDVSFNEHKVNGKSKGQAYLEFESPQSASAAKTQIESLTEGPNNTRTFLAQFNNPSNNPFKSLPKDAPTRDKDQRYGRGGAYNSTPPRGDYRGDYGSGYRGRGRGFDRGGHNNQSFNRNFSGPAGNFNGGGFNSNMGMMNNFGFNRGGGMMGNMRGNMNGFRGGRGGMNNNMMPMNTGTGMGMGMGMNPMMSGMGMPGFQGNTFGMFSQGGFGNDWNQSGNKRQRQE